MRASKFLWGLAAPLRNNRIKPWMLTLLVSLGLLCPSTFGGVVGSVNRLDTADGVQSVVVNIGDMIIISTDSTTAQDLPTISLTGSQTTRKLATVTTVDAHLVYLQVIGSGTSRLTVEYRLKNSPTPLKVEYEISVLSSRPGRLIELGQDGSTLTDLETGKPPRDGLRVGDLLRFKIGKSNEFEAVTQHSTKGSSLAVANVVYDSGVVYAFFTADAVGVSEISVKYKTIGVPDDKGLKSAPLTVLP